MQRGSYVVSLPFRVAAGFLLLLFLWGFLGEESKLSDPTAYEYELSAKPAHHGDYIPVGERVELQGLTARFDLNGVDGRSVRGGCVAVGPSVSFFLIMMMVLIVVVVVVVL